MLFYQARHEDVLRELGVTEGGLDASQAAQRLREVGPNTIRVRGEPWWRKLVEPFASVFMVVLVLAAGIALWNGEPLDASIIGLIVAISATIYYVQRFSTDRVLRALRKHDLQNVEVLREGKAVEIPADKLVPGDVILLNEGQKIPADVRLMHADGVRADESLLTGESIPVSKQVHPLTDKKEVYEQTNMLFQGTFLVAGQATAVVVATGNRTQFGQLAALAEERNLESPVQRKIDKLVSQLIVVVAAVALVVFGLTLYRGMELSEALRFMLSVAVSAAPEDVPIALSVILVLGMRRMAKHKALVRNMAAIENVGILTTIATDKTGTLTKNQLTVQKIWQPAGRTDQAYISQHILLAVNAIKGKMHDPLDTAMHNFAHQQSAKIPAAYKQIAIMPFDHQFSMSGNVWKTGRDYMAALKGAPEQILARADLSKNQETAAHHELHSLTGQGFRVIALASVVVSKKVTTLKDLPTKNLHFIGFIAVADILRPQAKSAVAAAQAAGVTVRMITGDHFETAYSIGKQLGLAHHRDQVFDSRQMKDLSDKELEKIVEKTRVFSRVVPEQKFRILTILKKKEIAAMTGDGVNDVPALANAHIGVAMGSGSQIAKEAGDMVLLDDNFRSIIRAIEEGRTIFNNIRRMLFYLLATSAGEVITMISALLLGIPLPVAAVQILWINLVTDTALVIPLGLEPAEKGAMKVGPRRPNQPILDRFLIARMVLVATVMAAVALGTFYYFLQFTSEEYARTIAFSVLVVMQWANAFNARSEFESIFSRLRVVNTKFYIGLTLAISLQILAIFGPLQGALHVVPVELGHLVATGAIAIFAIIAAAEIHKFIGRRKGNK